MCIAYQSCAQAPSVAILRLKKVDQNIVGEIFRLPNNV